MKSFLAGIKQNINLSGFNTFRTGGNARFFCEVKDENEFMEVLKFAKDNNLKFFVIGNGSNLLISDENFSGLVIRMCIKGNPSQIKSQFEPSEIKNTFHKSSGAGKIESKTRNHSIVSAFAGESFDDLIMFAVENNLSGIENLWNIPGTVGASAVQNIGAYGIEAKDFIVSVEGIDANNFKKFVLKNEDCGLEYRNSIFKNNKNLILTKVFFKLNNYFSPNLEYPALKEYFSNLPAQAGKKPAKVEEVIKAVEEIRRGKLPDWKVFGTAGSFFKNPVITEEKYKKLLSKYPDLPKYNAEVGFVKIPLGYVIDKMCGLRGLKDKNVGLYDKQPLVIVNYGGATCLEIDSFAKNIEKKVFEKINIKIEREVENIFLKKLSTGEKLL